MSIPSAVLVEEIKEQGFSVLPEENAFGEICIGYGHRIMDNPDLLSSHDSDLAHAIKLYNGNGFYDLNNGELVDYQKNLHEMILSCEFRIDRTKAEELLLGDILNCFDELSRESSAFRHLLNLCGNGYLLPKTQMSVHYEKLKNQNPLLSGNISNSSENFRRPSAYQKNSKNARFGASSTRQKEEGLLHNPSASLSHAISLGSMLNSQQSAFGYDDSAKSSSSSSPRNNMINATYSYSQKNTNKNTREARTSARFNKSGKSGTSAKSGKSGKSKKADWEFLERPCSENDSALVRLDTLVYLAHFIGVQKVLDMKAVLACIKMGDFMSAGGYLLSNSWAESLGEKAVILSRRMRYGILVRDIQEEIPEHLKQDFIDNNLIETEIEDDDDFYENVPQEKDVRASVLQEI